MKLNFVVGLCFLFVILLCQSSLAQFNPSHWKGDVSSFKITNESIDLNAEALTSEKYISTPSDAINNAQWLVNLQLDFNPSSANLVKLYLVSDKQDLSAPLKGYFVLVGNSQDEISLYRQDDDVTTKIIDGQDGRLSHSTLQIAIKISRSNTGDWFLSSKVNDDSSYLTEGTVHDPNHKQSAFAGFQCIFTSTRSKKMHFTRFDVSGDAYVDTDPPLVSSCVAVSQNKLHILFNEVIQLTSQDIENINNDLMIKQVKVDSNRVIIDFVSALNTNTDYHIRIKQVEDQFANRATNVDCHFRYTPFVIKTVFFTSPYEMIVIVNKQMAEQVIENKNFSLNGQPPSSIKLKDPKSLILTFNTPINVDVNMPFIAHSLVDIHGTQLVPVDSIIRNHSALPLDVVMTEIMADPSPAVALPELEYIEIYNRSAHTISLQNWSFFINDKSISLPDAYITPHSYEILCKDVSRYTDNARSIPSLSIPAIPNSAASLSLVSADSVCIDWIPYQIGMQEESFKAEGGWSLERKDVENFSYVNNWTTSQSLSGGTPLQLNSHLETVYDETGPYLIATEFIGDTSIVIGFSERVIVDKDNKSSSFFQDVSQDPTKPNYLKIRLSEPIDSFLISEISLSGINDMNRHTCLQKTLRYTLPKKINPGDLIINELMSNPLPDAPEYIELFNTTERFLDISELWIGKRNKEGLIEKAWDVTTRPNILAPSSFLLLLSQAPDTITYHQNLLVCPKLSLNNDSGSIILMNMHTTLVDEFTYKKEYHSPLIKEEKGVALEKINPFLKTNDPSNWTSAAGTHGYATPGKKNSQYDATEISDDTWISYSTRSVSPNGDGENDILIIRLNQIEKNSYITSSVYTINGKLLKRVVNNINSGTNNHIKWDGSDDSGKRLPSGIYVLLTKLYTSKGQEKTDKVAIAISAN